ncbi:MAG: hypothetical protein K2F90_05135 [Clostridiales bacterium]|nr:hypothetical protein [Clostridiales bacterium]
MSKKTKKYADDDGRTIVDMNVEGFRWYRPNKSDKKVDKEDRPTRKETRAMMRAWFAAYLPRIFALIVGFGLAAAIVVCWLNGWFIK